MMTTESVYLPLKTTSEFGEILDREGYGVFSVEGPKSTNDITIEVFMCVNSHGAVVMATVAQWNDGRELPFVTLSAFRKPWRFWLRKRDAKLVVEIKKTLVDQIASNT